MSNGTAVASTGRAIYPSIRDKRVLITGGASGIGEGMVEAFVTQGANVHFVDVAVEAGEALAARLAADAAHAPVFTRCDLTDLAEVKSVVTSLAGDGFDVVVNNAANDDRHGIDDVTPEYWDNRMSVNLRHQFFVTQAALPGMIARGGGSVINLGSISWHLGLEDLTLYQTAKAAIEGLTRSLARELGRHDIRVNAIIPGNVRTERQLKWYTPEGEAEIVKAQCLKGRIHPVDIAAMALFLASDDAHLCTAHNYWVDAGWR